MYSRSQKKVTVLLSFNVHSTPTGVPFMGCLLAVQVKSYLSYAILHRGVYTGYVSTRGIFIDVPYVV